MGDIACGTGARYSRTDLPAPALRRRLVQISDPDSAAFLEIDSSVVSASKDKHGLRRSLNPAFINQFAPSV